MGKNKGEKKYHTLKELLKNDILSGVYQPGDKMPSEKLEQAGKKLGIDLSVETQGAMGIQNQFSPEQIDEADYIVIAADVAIDEASRFGNKKLYVTSLEDAIVHPEQILESLTTKSYSYQDATVSNKKILG